MTENRKPSEILRQQAAEEENDIKAFAIGGKVIREERKERFEENYLPALREKFEVYERPNGSYTIDETPFGVIDYFPKANKVLIRANRKWHTAGMKWMRKNLLNENTDNHGTENSKD